jgi:hypothetical protein
VELSSKLTESVAGSITDKFGEHLISPAFVFWAGGVFAYGWKFGEAKLARVVESLNTAEIILVAVGALVLVSASDVLIEWLEFSVLRILEGYWWRPFNLFRRPLVGFQRWMFRRQKGEWDRLAARYKSLSPAQRRRYRMLDRRLLTFPEDENSIQPTRLGNILTAAESYPQRRYGLAAALMWPRLWFVLSPDDRTELTKARSALDNAIGGVIWSVLFAVWGYFVWWAFIAALLGAIGSYRRALSAAASFGELLKAAFDTNQQELFKRLNWPPPQVGDAESGTGLSVWLRRGTIRKTVRKRHRLSTVLLAMVLLAILRWIRRRRFD